MARYTLHMHDTQCETTREIELDSLDTARAAVHDEIEDWVSDGDWGTAGASVDVRWALVDSAGAEVDSDWHTVQVEPDHDVLIRAAGGDTQCDHEWVATVEVEGGLDENPGCWSIGGTTMVFDSHCERCGLKRREVSHGAQRNPGEADTFEYELPTAEDLAAMGLGD